MIQEDRAFEKESNSLGDAGLTPAVTGYEAYKEWAKPEPNQGISPSQMDAGTPAIQTSFAQTEQENKPTNDIAELVNRANKTDADTMKFAYKESEVSKRYPKNFIGIDNESLYADNQTTAEKAYNGVVKMVGTAGTTFVNGTVGTVYGIIKAKETGKIQAFYDNDLSNYLNNINTEMEDTYAHYKTERERTGDWYEPANLFTGNFLFDNVIKNLGFSLGAMGAGFAWGGALKALGATGRLMGTGAKWATSADAAIAEASTLPQAQRLSFINARINELASSAKGAIGKALMKTDRGIVATFGTFGEAGLEALNNSQEFRNNMIEEFKNVHGYDPNKNELADIDKYAESVGNVSFGLNSVLLTATNYIQLPKIYSSSFKGERTILNNIAREGEKYVTTLPEKGFGKLMYKTKNIASLAFNTSEAFEEGSQYAIQTGTQNYYNKKYNNYNPSAIEDGLLHGVKEALTTGEGTLNIFLGGFSGALQSSGVVGVKGFMPVVGQTGKIGERGWTGYGGEEAKYRDEAVGAFNKTMIRDKMKDVFSNIKQAETIQQDREAAIRRGDILESKDLEFDYAHSFISSRLKYGAKEAIDDEIQNLKQQAITDSGFTELQQAGVTAPTDTKEAFIKRLDNLQQHANHAAKIYEMADIKYKSLVNDKGEKVFPDEVIDKLVYAGSKVMDYDRRIPELNLSLSSAGVNITSVLDDIINKEMDVKEVLDPIIADVKKQKLLNEDDILTDLNDIVEASMRRNQFVDEYKDILRKPENFKEEATKPLATQVTTPEDVDKSVTTIKVVTKKGERELKTGTEYFLGKVIELDKNGNEVYRAPRLTILGENEDGTIKIKTSGGVIRDISKDELASYSLAPVESTLKNKKAKFFMEHWNTVYEHYGIKINGKPVKGRLIYDEENDKDGILTFVYLDRKGKTREVEVPSKLFKAKKGYPHAMLKAVGELTAAQQKSQDEFANSQDKRALAALNKRMDILIELYDGITAKQEKAKRLVESKLALLDNYKTELKTLTTIIENKPQYDKRYKKATVFKKVTAKAIARAMQVSRMIEQLENEVTEQETTIDDLESNLAQLDSFIDNLEDQPVDYEDFILKLRYERIVLVDAIKEGNKTINFLHKAIKSAKDLLNSTLKSINNFITEFSSKYPEAPFSVSQVIEQNPGYLSLNTDFVSDLKSLEDRVALAEDNAQIDVKEKQIEDLEEHLDIAIGDLKALEDQLKAHDLILDAFRERARQYKEQKREEAVLTRNEDLKQEFLGTNSVDVQNTITDKKYDPISKKDWVNVISSTIVPSTREYNKVTKQYEERELRPHHARSNRFGFRLGTGEVNGDNVQGYVVTSKTQEEILPGLTEHLVHGTALDNTDVVVLVLTRKNDDGEFELVDEFGKAIPADDIDKLNKAIYQVFPSEKLSATYEGETKSMFRDDITEGQRKDLEEQYALWRNTELSKDKLSVTPEPIAASFGIPQYVTRLDEKGKTVRDYDAKTPAIKSGLIDEDTLRTKPVIHVVTTDKNYQHGTTGYSSPLGRVFLEAQTGATKLLNRVFNKNEAENIYNAILQLSKNSRDHKTLKTTESKEILDWLKTVVYWGIPKTPEKERKAAGYNSIWFEEVKDEKGTKTVRLFVSGLGGNFMFTPLSIEENKSAIISLLEAMYSNTNANLVNEKSYTKPYFEITGFDKEGKAITKQWPNYQTYLLSDKMPDSEGNLTLSRKANEIPLVTNMKEVSEGETNRDGIYFIRKTANEFFSLKEPEVKTPAPVAGPVQSPTVNKTPPVTAVVPTNVTPGNFVLDGVTPNIKQIKDPANPTKSVGGTTFTLDGPKAIEMLATEDGDVFSDNIKRIKFTQRLLKDKVLVVTEPHENIMMALIMGLGQDENMVKLGIAVGIVNDVAPQLTVQSIPVQPPVSDVVTSPVVTPKVPTGAPKEEIKPEDLVTLSTKEIEDAVEEGGWEEMGITPTEATPPSSSIDDIFGSFSGNVVDDDPVYRELLSNEVSDFEKEDWGEVENWLKINFPNIPVHRVKNVIKATNGRQAWGYFQNGAIYVYEQAEVGTVYHEVFEAVWKAFAGPNEKEKILKEFKSRPGSFKYPFTGKEIKYSEATNQEIKETLAEEFRTKVLYNENPVSYKGGNLIQRLFDDLINFIKEFFTGNKAISNTEKLFKKIGEGFYRDYNPYEAKLSLAYRGVIDVESAIPTVRAEFRITTIPEVQVQELISHMTYLTLDKIVKEGSNLFAIETEGRTDLYNRIKKDILGDPADYTNSPGILRNKGNMFVKNVIDGLSTREEITPKLNNIAELIKNTEIEWDNIVKRHETYLKTYGITFDENDDINLNKEEQTNKSFEVDARTVDAYRKSSPTVRLLLSALPRTEMHKVKTKDDKGRDILVDKMEVKKTSINGFQLLPGDFVFNTLMNRLHDSVDSVEMLNRLSDIALQDPTFSHLYRVLTKNDPSVKVKSLDTSKYKQSDLQLISAFWKSFKKQNADVVSVFIFPGGEIVIGDSSLSSAAKQVKRELFNSVTSTLRTKDNYVKYDPTSQKYNATSIVSNYQFDKNHKSYETFLNNLGIDFTAADLGRLDTKQQTAFRETVHGLKNSIAEINNYSSLTNKTLNLEGRLLQLATLKVIATKKASGEAEFENTYFNINGERSQSFIGVNILSNMYDVISKINNINDLANTEYAYLLTDVFSKGKASAVLNKIFDIEGKGERRGNTEDLLHPVYIDGTIDEESGKKKESSKLTYVQRLAQELNLNFNGYYLNLVPGDASIEWASKLYEKDSPFVTEEEVNKNGYLKIFKDYFISEVMLSRDDRKLFTGRDNKDLRFFKDILPKDVHDAIIKNTSQSPEDIYESKEYKDRIEKAIIDFVTNDADELEATLRSYNLISYNEEGMTLNKLDFGIEDSNITQEQLDNKLKFLTVNYMIANVEFHKLLYSDPYLYSDELKRIKNFNSPRQALITGSAVINNAFSQAYNEGFEEDDTFYTDFSKDHFSTITIEDTFSHDAELEYDPFEDTDGGGYFNYKAYRWFRILAGDWSDACESQFRHDVGYEKLVKSGAPKEEITSYEKKNPEVSDAYRAIKPIVAGAKDSNRNYNDVMMDKFALVPLSFRILHKLGPNSNALKFYNKLQVENIDYGVYGTGRKVGAEIISPLYNEKGEFNTVPYRNAEQEKNPDLPQAIIKVPHTIISVQAEVPTKTVAKTTEGSQITQLATLDYMEAGVPIDYNPGQDLNSRLEDWYNLSEDERLDTSDLYKEIVTNQKLLEVRILQGYEKLLHKTGIKETADGYIITDKDKLINTLSDEILKREINENIIEAFEGVKTDKVVMEATPAYKQIRNILFSMANKSVVSKKITGKMAVQVPERLLESGNIKVEQVKTKSGKVVTVYNSDNLKFYRDEDGKRVCEIMVGRWFNSDKTDEELINYLNNTEEGQKILEGVGFRIPTQKQNSIDAFRIKQFLPKEFGDNVVIPAALVKKVGSDFDIDKLSMYFKNVKNNKEGYPELVKLLNDENSTVEERYYNFVMDHAYGESLDEEELLEERTDKNSVIITLGKGLIVGAVAREQGIEDLDTFKRRSIEMQNSPEAVDNAYQQSLFNLISHPLNFERLIVPNSAQQMKDLNDEIGRLTGRPKTDYKSVGNMLKRGFMSNLRHAFVTGKYAIGIAAIAQTNHSQNQRSPIVIEDERLEALSKKDRFWLKDGKINFHQYNSIFYNGKIRPTLSLAKNKAGDYISDIIGQFIDGYVDISKGPWIMELGATPNVAGTWLFLTKLGVPIETVAYFMNQPIIKDYLRMIEAQGYTYLFIDSYAKLMKEVYEPQADLEVNTLPDNEGFKKMLGKNAGNLSESEKAQQVFILDEFTKYAKMSEHLFYLTQGSNYNTATFSDPFMLLQKKYQLARARRTIISSVDNILNKSFIGVLKDKLENINDAYSLLLISNKKTRPGGPVGTAEVLEEVLVPYIEKSSNDFLKIGQKAVVDLFDWVIQTSGTQRRNKYITDVLVGKQGSRSASEEVMDYKNKVMSNPSHPLYNNLVIKNFNIIKGNREGKIDALYIAGKDNKVYEQNLIINAFREIKDQLAAEKSDLYTKIVGLTILQSGLASSPVSFTQLLPYEDFINTYNEMLSKLDENDTLGKFADLNVFQRVNWSNTDIVPFKRFFLFKSKKGKWFNPNLDFRDKRLMNASSNGKIPMMLNISEMSMEGNNDIISYSWEPKHLTKYEKGQMKRKGDYSYIKKGLFQKVYTLDDNGNSVPLMQIANYQGKEYRNYIYKAINAWGDSFKGREMYDTNQTSVLDNDYEKVFAEFDPVSGKQVAAGEVDDAVIVDVMGGYPENIVPLAVTEEEKNTPPGLPGINKSPEKC